MAKAIVHRQFDATDLTKGTSMRINPHDDPKNYPAWVIAAGEAVGAAVRVDPPINKPAAAGETE